MADYYSNFVVRTEIPAADMSLLEFFLLSEMITVETEGGNHFLCSDVGVNDLIWVKPSELGEAFRDSVNHTSQVAHIVAEWLDNVPPGTEQEEQEFSLDVRRAEEIHELILQDIVRRSSSLKYIELCGANTCSKMRPDGFGGWASVITADQIHWMTTDGWLEATIAALETNSDTGSPPA